MNTRPDNFKMGPKSEHCIDMIMATAKVRICYNYDGFFKKHKSRIIRSK